MLTLLTLGAHVQQSYGTQFVRPSVCLSVTMLAATDFIHVTSIGYSSLPYDDF